MLKSFSIKLDSLPRPLKFVRVLEEFDGDILSQYQADKGGTYLEKWCTRDRETSIDRYLVVRTEPRAISEYLAERISMLDLLSHFNDGFGFIIDRLNGKDANTFLVNLNELPLEYMPDDSTYHEKSLRPEWEMIPQDFIVDKKSWDPSLFATIERRYMEVFGFVYFTGNDKKLPAQIFEYDHNGGYSVMHSFKTIRWEVPEVERAKSVGVFANSPGLLTINAPAAIVKKLEKCYESLSESNEFYQKLHEWTKLKPENVKDLPLSAYFDLSNLASKLNVNVDSLFANSFDSKKEEFTKEENLKLLIAGKLIASYYRKLILLLKPDDGVNFISIKNK